MATNIRRSIDPIKISSLNEFLEIIMDKNKGGKMWFRGQADINYPLLPSVLRRMVIIEDQFGRLVKPRPVTVFSNHGDRCMIPDGIYLKTFREFLEQQHIFYEGMNELEFICLAQHYGVRTRLLDWTTDAMVALFFSLESWKAGTSAGFYILDPYKMNGYYTESAEIYTYETCPELGVFPIAFYGPRKDKRMCRQSGNFTIHGGLVWPIDYNYGAEKYLTRIEIPSEICVGLREKLSKLGITYDSIYLGYDIKDEIAREAQKVTEEIYTKELQRLEAEWERSGEKGIDRHIYF